MNTCRGLVIIAIVTLGCAALATEFYVAPTGADTNPGTKAQPFATVSRAQQAVRTTEDDVTVYLRGGVYEVPAPLVFEPEDGGAEGRHVTYAAFAGETPVISGGRQLTEAWIISASRFICDLEKPAAGAYPRHLWINGRRAERARWPKEGYFYGLQTANAITLTFPEGHLKAWPTPGNVELVALVEWTAARQPLPTPNLAARTLTFPGESLPLFSSPTIAHVKRNVTKFPYYFENVPDSAVPGQWWLNRATGRLEYTCRPEDLEALFTSTPKRYGNATARRVAPQDEPFRPVVSRLSHIITVRGTPEHPVRNLTFRGLTFSYTDWPLPAGGFLPNQAGFDGKTGGQRIDAAMTWEYVTESTVERCRFTHLGGSGISLRRGCRQNTLFGNVVADVAANGIEIGGHDANPPAADLTRGNLLFDNYLHHCGVDFPGSVGIWVGIAEGTRVTHNLLHDLPYTGISVGWNWTRTPTACRENVISYNHIHHVMQLLADGGGIYVLGNQPGSELRGNLIHDVAHFSGIAGNNGIFIDNGSQGWHIEGNMIYATADAPIRHNGNKPTDHTWGNNHLNVMPNDPLYPATLAAQAGLEPAYRWLAQHD